jgi:hypothetical protein
MVFLGSMVFLPYLIGKINYNMNLPGSYRLFRHLDYFRQILILIKKFPTIFNYVSLPILFFVCHRTLPRNSLTSNT